MALNLVRNSKVFFTTNVDATTGIIKQDTAFTATNTTEIQVLDGFTFSQNTNQDTVTISEAGTAPVRGQRSFNTSLAPVDFSFSNYLRPYKSGSTITAEESVLWNALLSDQAVSTGTVAGAAGSATYSYANGISTLTFTGLSLASAFTVGDVIVIGGLVCSIAGESAFFNSAATVTAVSTTVGMTVELVNASAATKTSTFTISATTTKFYKSAWAPVDSAYSLVTAGGSNKNQLQKFGMLFLVDQVLYAVDNCALNQVSIDFGLDAIATAAWTGQATQIRKLAEGSTAVTGTFAGNTITVGAGTVSAVAGSGSAYTATYTLTAAAALPALAVGQVVTAAGTGQLGTAAKITAITITTGNVVSFTVSSTTTGTAGASTGVTAYTWLGGVYTQKVTAAAYITNKLSTVTLTTLNALLNAAGTSISASGTAYAVALTGGSITINNNISYITPANLGVVNVPVTYYTGTRAITGTLNAYLKTGVGAQSTGQLLSDLLDSSTVTTEPMFALALNIGGSSSTANRVILDLPSVTLTLPTVDVQQVVSTSINFTAQGSTPTSTTAAVYDLAETNDITVRYYGV